MNLIKKHLFFILFFALLLFLIFLTYKDYGIPWDEKIYFSVGKYYLKATLDLFHVRNNLDTGGFVPTDYHIKGHGVVSDIMVIAASILFPHFSFETLHLVRAIFGVFIFILVYKIVEELLNKKSAFMAMILLLLFPRFYSDLFYNAVDIPTALFFTVCISYFFYFAKTKITAIKSSVFGLILAFSINQRLILAYLIPVDFFILFLLQRYKKKLKIWLFVWHFLIIVASTFLFLHLSHPYLLSHPITGLADIVRHARQYPWNAAVLFDGVFYQAGIKPLPWYYLPKSIAITIPLITLALFIIGQIRLIGLIRKKEKNLSKKFLCLYLLLVFYLPFLLTFILKPTLYDSWRQYLFLTIPIIIIAAFGFDWLLNLKSKVLKSIIFIFLFFSLILTGREMIMIHPYEYIYYNSFVGGLKGAYGKYETDYWGLAYKESIVWFNKNVNDKNKTYKIWVEADPLSSSYYFQPNMSLTQIMNDADYIFTFTRWNFHLRHPGKTIYTVQREDIPLVFIKEINK